MGIAVRLGPGPSREAAFQATRSKPAGRAGISVEAAAMSPDCAVLGSPDRPALHRGPVWRSGKRTGFLAFRVFGRQQAWPGWDNASERQRLVVGTTTGPSPSGAASQRGEPLFAGKRSGRTKPMRLRDTPARSPAEPSINRLRAPLRAFAPVRARPRGRARRGGGSAIRRVRAP